jgi:hypothetical protein
MSSGVDLSANGGYSDRTRRSRLRCATRLDVIVEVLSLADYHTVERQLEKTNPHNHQA